MGKAGFRGGVHPPTFKEATRDVDTTRAPLPERIVLPMSQHLGAPCIPTVAVGERVARGQVVGDIDAMVSAPIHSPVNGEVTAVGTCITPGGTRGASVEVAPDADQDFASFVPLADAEDPRDIVRAAGIVGLGGAAFPSHVKLRPPHDMPVGVVILNGCECEPFLTCDDRLMRERPQRVVAGARHIRDMVGAARIIIGIEDNKPEAIASISAEAGEDVEVLVLPTNYPQGAEKQLIWATLGKEVPHGKLPAATGALVHNVGTAAAIADAIELKKPLMERIVTVTGAVARPANYLALLGTPLATLVAQSGGLIGDVDRVIAGGPMTGAALADLSVPLVKGTSGVVGLERGVAAPAVNDDQACIRCGRCSRACPMSLEPFAIGIHANRGDWDGSERFMALDCIECGCCSFVCPTRRPLVQLIRRAKGALMQRGSRS